MRVFVDEVRPGVRQAMEDALVDTANDWRNWRAATCGRRHRRRPLRRRVDSASPAHRCRCLEVPQGPVDYRIYITDARGIVVYDRSVGTQGGTIRAGTTSTARCTADTARGPAGSAGWRLHTVMHVSAPIRDAAGKIIGVLTVANPNRTTEPFILASQREMLRKGGVLLGLSALIGLAMTLWLARGIGRLDTYAQAVSAGRRAEPPPRRRDEIGDLGQALETMRRKLDGKDYVEGYVQARDARNEGTARGDPRRRRVVAGAAACDGARTVRTQRPATGRAAHRNDRQAVGAGRSGTARLAGGFGGDRGRPLIADVIDLLSPVAQQHDVSLVAGQVPDGLRVAGDRFLLRQALLNLGDNAIAFAPKGSTVTWSVGEDSGVVTLSCRDEGPGVPDYATERVFERFYSLSRPRSGERSSGLGLPFVREVATLHHGRAFLRNCAGGGAIAGIELAKA